MSKKLTTEEFIQKAKQVHDDKYDYCKVKYINQNTEVILLCNKCHKEFLIKPVRHIHRKVGCPNCSKTKKLTIEDFIKRAREIHGEKYDYSEYQMINDATKSTIICECGNRFQQSYMNHVRLKQGCPVCKGGIFVSLKKQLEKCNIIHNNKYNYSLIDEKTYITRQNKIKIICPIHGKFNMTMGNHLNGQGCVKCRKSKTPMTPDEYLKKVDLLYTSIYKYDLTNYETTKSIIKITCPIHGKFEKIAARHLYNKQGCPVCKSSKGEQLIRKILIEKNIVFEQEYKFKDCKDKSYLPFDFYLPEYNLLIEYDGIQHFEHIEFFGDVKSFEETKRRDNIKSDYCKKNNINLLRLNYTQDSEICETNILKHLS